MGEISTDVADQIRDVAREWARGCGEDSPSMRAVAVTHGEALAFVHDDPDAVNTYLAGPDWANPIYLVVLEGEFDYHPDSEHVVAGKWAALMFKQRSLEFRLHTVRPEGYIPSMDLRRLGDVHQL